MSSSVVICGPDRLSKPAVAAYHLSSSIVIYRHRAGETLVSSITPLNVSDMRPMGDVGSAGQSEGRHNIPWIWKAPGVLHNNDAGLQDCLWVEWCKARARASRWSEECSLLIEEMQRVLVFFLLGNSSMEGTRYCEVMAVREGLFAHFSIIWKNTLSAVVSELDPVPTINAEVTDDQTPSLEGPPLQADDE
ncbi:uncharacterized protein F5147DRAFT_766387 [Suillus discolor]|uniref:Uncharacterized protein n=1 Tax=Suillus discolor TaxID=1912936 RepID=A0A9P7FLZ5_9AGAM|nr:uncharacterized protein F5147DRAFT_766387 [Suillus discolor]KAG2120466.1 hypothetical protein F5147DRAFT_766387 [Suillus discolor]